MIQWFLSLSLIGFSTQAQLTTTPSPSACDGFRSEAFRDQHYNARLGNCAKLLESADVPNREALNYTLKYLAQNYKSLKDSHCAMDGLEKDIVCRICKDPDRIRQGIQNGCSFILNDLKKSWGDGTTRKTGYHVDLCADPASPVVQKFYINMGTGEFAIDITGKKSTLPGAFLTDDRIIPFEPYSDPGKKYEALKKQLGGTVPGIRLVGLNSSNNSSEDSKPLHVAPYQTSSGCTSVNLNTIPIMKKLVKNGPALIMNYHSNQYEQSASCNNEDSGIRRKSNETRGGLR